MKKFTKFEIATIKRTAMNVNPMVTKRAKIAEKITELSEEYDKLTKMQEQYEASIRTMTGGYGTEDLISKVIEDTGKLDKDGKPIKVTKYVWKYPETIVPPIEVSVEETVSTDVVDDTEKAPEVEVPVEEAVVIAPTVQSPLAMEHNEHGTNMDELPFNEQ